MGGVFGKVVVVEVWIVVWAWFVGVVCGEKQWHDTLIDQEEQTMRFECQLFPGVGRRRRKKRRRRRRRKRGRRRRMVN